MRNLINLIALFIITLSINSQSNISGGSVTWEFIDSGSVSCNICQLPISTSDYGKMRLKLVFYSSDNRASGSKLVHTNLPTLRTIKLKHFSEALIHINGAAPKPFVKYTYYTDPFVIPSDIWSKLDFIEFVVQDLKRVKDVGVGSEDARNDSYLNYGERPTNYTSDWSYQYMNFVSRIFPYIENGRKIPPSELKDNGSVVRHYGFQGGFTGSSPASYVSVAQDKEGDDLRYRWEDPMDPLQSPTFPIEYITNHKFIIPWRDGYSGDSPIFANVDDSDNFYLNPYTGASSFTHRGSDYGYRANAVAIDSYKNGQLVGTVIAETPYEIQNTTTSNQAPSLTLTSTDNTFVSENTYSYPSLSSNISHLSNIKVSINEYPSIRTITKPHIPYADPLDNNGEVLLFKIDTGEGRTVSINMNFSDPEGDVMTPNWFAVDSDLFSSETASFTNNGDGTATWTWTPSLDVVPDGEDSQDVRIIFEVQDNGSPIAALPQRRLVPLDITVFAAKESPNVTISAQKSSSNTTAISDGSTTNDGSIMVSLSVSGLDGISSFIKKIEETDLVLSNATVSSFAEVSPSLYTFTLTPTGDPTSAGVAIVRLLYLSVVCLL